MKHRSRYKLFLCVGYADAARTVISAIDVVSADSSDNACRMFVDHPELARAGVVIASADVRYVADGSLEKSWRMLRYAGGDVAVKERAKAPPDPPRLVVHKPIPPKPRPFALPSTVGELIRGK